MARRMPGSRASILATRLCSQVLSLRAWRLRTLAFVSGSKGSSARRSKGPVWLKTAMPQKCCASSCRRLPTATEVDYRQTCLPRQ